MKNVNGINQCSLSRCCDVAAGISKKRFRHFIFIHGAAALICIAPGLSLASSTITFLHTDGQNIVNERGAKILLRGVGLGNWMLPEGYMWKFGNQADRPRRIEKLVSDLIGLENGRRFWSEFRKNYITEADIQRIAELGYNSVRPALNARLFLSETGTPTGSEEGFLLLDHLIAWGKAHDIYVILDMHAAPGGQTGQNIDDSANDQPELFTNSKYQDQLVALWKAIAQRYKDEPAVAGYDLLNEPLPERTGAAKSYKAGLEPLYKRITQAIREVDPKHIIILEGADWSNDWSVFSRPFAKNLVYQFHYYCWDNPPVVKSIQRYLDYRERFNAPVWVGETGEKDNTIYWATTEYFEANNIGWAFWPWKKMDTQNTPCSIKVPTGWGAISAYSNGGEKPAIEIAQKAFDELLVNIRLENCVFFPEVVNAMLRRAPARIEGENFGQEGMNKSYFVKQAGRNSNHYRLSAPVAITSLETDRRQSDQYITISAQEWTAYSIASESLKDYSVIVRVKTQNGPGEAQLIVGGQVRTVTIAENGWVEIKLKTVTLAQGANRLKWLVTRGVVDLDWFELRPVEKRLQSASHSSVLLK